MNPFLQVVISAALVVIAGCLYGILQALKQLSGQLQARSLFARIHDNFVSSGMTAGETISGYGVFAFRDGSWQLQADLSAAGCEVNPPLIPGRYEGQVVRREAQPRS